MIESVGIIRKIILIVCLLLGVLTADSAFAQSSILGGKEFLQGDYDGLLNAVLDYAAENPQHAYLAMIVASELNRQYFSKSGLGREKLESLRENKILDPLAENLVLKMLADAAGSRGEQSAATELRRERGLIPVWRIAGPFGEYDNSSFYQSFAPEAGIDFSIFMQGLGKSVTWRLLSESVCLNHFTPYKWVAPQRGVIYLYTQFKLEQKQKVVLEKSGRGSYKFWVDGYEVGVADPLQEETAKVLRLQSSEKLSAGWHRVLIKIYAADYDAEFSCRLLDENFKPLNGVSYGLKKIQGKDNFGSKLWKKVAPDQENFSLGEQALYYQYQGMYDKALNYWQAAIIKQPHDAALRVHYAMCASQARDILPGSMRESIVQREALKAFELDKNSVASLLLLAEYERRHKRYKRAGEYFALGLKNNPKAIMLHGARIRMAMENDWSGEIIDWMARFTEIYPQSYLLRLLQGMYYNNQGFVSKAAAALAEAKSMSQENIIVSVDAVKSFLAAGEVEKAVRCWEQLPFYLQKRADLLVLYSEILSRLKEKEHALSTLNQALNAVGNDERIKRIAGDVCFRNGDDQQALALYKESLGLAAGNYFLRRLITNLEGRNYKFWEDYEINPFKKIDEFISSNKKYFGRTVKLVDQTVLTLYPGGAYANYTHELQTVRTDSGVLQAAKINTYGELLQARTIIPESGVVLEPVVLPGTGEITMPAVAPGAAIDHAYLYENAETSDRKLHFPKWYFRSPSSEESFLFSQYIVRVPLGVDFVFATRNLSDKVDFASFEEEDGTREFIWTGKNMPEAIHEEGSPAIGSTLPFVEIASRQSWDDIYRLMVKVYLGKIIPIIAIKEQVKELLAGLVSPAEKIAAIQRFVCRNVLSSTSRAPASHVFFQRFGNRSLLALAMFKAAGIKAELVAVRPPANILYDPVWKLPNAANFTEYFIRAFIDKEKLLWLDLRAKYAAAGKIGEDYAGGTGFVLGENKGEFVFLPEADEDSYMVRRQREYCVDVAVNHVAISGKIVYPGIRGWEFKENMAALSIEKREEVLENILMESLFGVSLESSSFPELEVSGKPFTAVYEAGVDDMIREKVNGSLGVPYNLPEIMMLPARNSNRRLTPYHLKNFLAANDKFEYNLPAGSVIGQLPEDVVVRSKFGLYSLVFSTQGNKIIVERKYLFKPQIISLDDWKSYRELVQQIKKVEAGYIWFR